MTHRDATACVKFNTAQFRHLGFLKTNSLSLAGLVMRKTTASSVD
jgi:hypothetical protein